MKRDLVTFIRARVEHLVDELVESIAVRVERQINDALEAARSALESDFEIAVRFSSDDVSSRPAEPGEASASVPAHQDRAPSSDTSPRRRSSRSPTCRKCGAVGFTSRSCGKTHNVPSVPAGGPRVDAAEVDPPSAASPRRQSRPPAPSELYDDDLDDEKTESPPPCYARRSLRCDRGVRPQAHRRAAGAAVLLRDLN